MKNLFLDIVLFLISRSSLMYKSIYILSSLLLLFSCSNAPQQNRTNSNSERTDKKEEIQQTTSQVVLPDSAQAFIQQHFESSASKYVKEKKSPKPEGTFYEVRLINDIEIDFGKLGNWIEVKAEGSHPLPTSFFPQKIQEYLNINYPNIDVESIDKDQNGYELELTNDFDLSFDRDGAFKRLKK